MKNIIKSSTDYRVFVTRFGVTRSRRFLNSKFGGPAHAKAKALEYADYLKNETTMHQFIKATRRVGRPAKTEFFGRRIIAN
jgi:hypothetical protein